MATRTVTSGDYIRPYRGAARIIHRPEDASETYKKGAPLCWGVAAGHEDRVAECGSDPTVVIGFASGDASGTTDADVTIWLADESAEFIGVVQANGTLDQTNVGSAFGLVYDGTNVIWRVDLSETTTTNVIVTELIDADADVNGRVAFRVKAAARSPFVD